MNYKVDPNAPLLYQDSLGVESLQGDWFGREMREIGRSLKRQEPKYVRRKKPFIWRDGEQYFSIRELANRRCWNYQRARGFVRSHPELTVREGHHPYCRDVRGERFPSSIVVNGKEYFRFAELARMRRVSFATIESWSSIRPELCLRFGARRYGRNEDWQHVLPSAYIWKDGVQYFGAAELARRRKVTITSIYSWAKNHPHLTYRDRRHLYARDEEWKSRKPGYVPPQPPGPTEEQKKFIMGRLARR